MKSHPIVSTFGPESIQLESSAQNPSGDGHAPGSDDFASDANTSSASQSGPFGPFQATHAMMKGDRVTCYANADIRIPYQVTAEMIGAKPQDDTQISDPGAAPTTFWNAASEEDIAYVLNSSNGKVWQPDWSASSAAQLQHVRDEGSTCRPPS